MAIQKLDDETLLMSQFFENVNQVLAVETFKGDPIALVEQGKAPAAAQKAANATKAAPAPKQQLAEEKVDVYKVEEAGNWYDRDFEKTGIRAENQDWYKGKILADDSLMEEEQ